MSKKKIAVTAETTIDLPKELLEKYDIHTVPFTILLGEESFIDGEIGPEKIFEYVEKEKILPRTCAVNEFQYDEFFNNLLKEYDGIVHFSLSHHISSAYEHACAIAKTLNNVYVIDTKSLSTGIALQAIKASELASECNDAKELYEKMLPYVEKTQASFVINTLEYMHKGGRCSSLARITSALLRMKPCIHMEDGKLNVIHKYIGRSRMVIEDYCKDILKEYPNANLERVFITYPSATPEMLEAATNACKKAGFKEIIQTTAGGTITTHCGPKTLGMLYLLK